MQFSVLGADAAMLPLFETIQARADHRLLGWYDSAEQDSLLRAWFPSARSAGTTDELLETSAKGVVIVGRGGDWRGREKALRELAATGVPLVLVQPPCSAIFGFELDMIQRDTQAAMVPFHAAALHPAVGLLTRWISHPPSCPVGTTEQVVLERRASDRDDQAVWVALSRDALLLRRMLGDFGQVGAMRSAEQASSFANLSVHLTTESVGMARWSMTPAEDHAEAILTLVGSEGRVALHMPEEGPWSLKRSNGELVEDFSAYDAVGTIDRYLTTALQGGEIEPTWEDACRAMDLADLAEESVRRGKTLAVHNERLTEEGTFKSIMAAGGCFLLLFTLAFLLVVMVVEGLNLPIRQTPLWKAWPIVLFSLIALFLGMQFLRVLFPRAEAVEKT